MKYILAALILPLIIGCASLSGNASAKLATQYATLKYVEGDAERAQRVRAVISQALGALTDETATVAAIKSVVMASINFDGMDPADRLLANTLLEMVEAELIERVGDGRLDADKVLVVREVLEWVDEAAVLGS